MLNSFYVKYNYLHCNGVLPFVYGSQEGLCLVELVCYMLSKRSLLRLF